MLITRDSINYSKGVQIKVFAILQKTCGLAGLKWDTNCWLMRGREYYSAMRKCVTHQKHFIKISFYSFIMLFLVILYCLMDYFSYSARVNVFMRTRFVI